MWIKAVTPLEDILKISPTTIREKAGIHTKPFGEKEYNNTEKTSTLQEACPLFGSNGEFIQTDLLNEVYSSNSNITKGPELIHEKDTFKCGRCKTQFQALTAFIDHKRTQCDFVQMTDEKTDSLSGGGVLFPDMVFSGDRLSPDSSEELIELIDDPAQSGILSFVVGNNQVFITNPLQLSELSNQLILSSSTGDKSELILTNDQAGSMVALDREMPDKLLLTGSPAIQNKGGNDIVLAAEVTNNASLINIDTEINGTEGLNLRDDMILEFQFGNDNPMKIDKTDRIKTKLPCSYCGKLFEKPFNLQQHERVHTGERPFQCVICGRAFSQKANVRKHMIRHKVWPQAKQTLKINVDQDSNNANDQELDRTSYSCQYCSLSFSSYSLHKKHLAVHSDFKVYRCIQKGCDATFSDLDEFLCHSESHSSAEFQCHVCLKIFTSLEELGAHQYDHDLPNRVRKDLNIKLKCEVCHAQFKSAESLKNHMAVDSHNYECPHCKSVFSCERFLRRHLATHSDPSQSKFECEFCKKTFRTQKYLNNHSFIHSKEKPFDCELCNKQFASKYRLKRHLAIHLSQYLECPFKAYLGCDKKFYRKDKLRNHVTTHSHLKIRSCQVCSKSFTSFTKLQQHMKCEHKAIKKKQMLKCINCSQMFRKQKQLLQHHCTIGEKLKSRTRNDTPKNNDSQELVANIEIIMVPYINN
ncbi:UNVERIFIED_CONTAM: hypothetical protein PYX00_006474 [Menopon gallinae]|uniref:C2H2-type domain-containing protein n=1 Tax=Menopon gallinae TaxID=328185 RepID=A0AAW2HWK5_9NEOP